MSNVLAPRTVSVTSLGFVPLSLDVKVGQDVTWVNNDDSELSLELHDEIVALAPGASHRRTFTVPGAYLARLASDTAIVGVVSVS